MLRLSDACIYSQCAGGLVPEAVLPDPTVCVRSVHKVRGWVCCYGMHSDALPAPSDRPIHVLREKELHWSHTQWVVVKRISARLWMRDLFSGCASVRMWRSCLAMSICTHAQNVNLRSRSGTETFITQGRQWRAELAFSDHVPQPLAQCAWTTGAWRSVRHHMHAYS